MERKTSEINTLRHSDGVKYMPYENFTSKFGNNKGRISFGKKYVVKKLNGIYGVEFVQELNAYSSFSHPCILKPKAWSYNGKNGYMSFKKGKDINEAFQDRDITIEEILSDVLSAVAFLNENGYIHGDIKSGNIIFQDGKAKLIDMGRFTKAKLNDDGQYYVKETLYTYIYRDPEYTVDQYTNIKCEIYSIASSCKEILEGELPYFGDVYSYRTDIPHIDWFLENATKLIEERKDINYLLNNAPKELIVRKHKGTIFTTPLISTDRKCDKRATILMSWLVIVAKSKKLDSEALFLCFHLIYRLFGKINEIYSNKTNSILQIFGCVVMNLSLNVISYGCIPISEWVRLTGSNPEEEPDFKNIYKELYLKVLELTNGVISTLTYWDYAQSREDLQVLLRSMVDCSYNPQIIVSMLPGTDKCVTVDMILSKEEIKIYDKNYPEVRKILTNGNEPSILPCSIDTRSSRTYIIEKWKNHIILGENNIHEYLPVLIHNRTSLSRLKSGISSLIFRSLLNFIHKNNNYYDLIDKFLTITCGKWKEISPNFDDNPFKKLSIHLVVE